MSHPFSEFIRGLDESGTSPSAEAFEEVWRLLAARLQREIKRRGLWRLPPSYLGVTGSARWHEAAVDELVAPCYEHIFIKRLGGLLAQLQVKENVDGLIRLHVRNFVHEQQRRHDPLGFRLYNVLRRALLGAIEDSELHVASGDPRLRADTVLVFRLGGAGDAAPPAPIADQVRRWNDELLPDLVTAQGPAQAPVVARLRRRVLEDLPMADVDAFRFGDLLDPFKEDVRARWARLLDQDFGDAAFEDDEDGWPRLVRRVEATDDVERRQHFESLVSCVSEGVARHPGSATVCRHLSTLWQFLRSWSVDEHGHRYEGDGAALPSRRRLSTLLRIPRDRLSELFGQLGEMVEACHAAIGAKAAVSSQGQADAASPARRTPPRRTPPRRSR